MPEFDISKSTENGLKFRNIFIDLMIFAIGTFLGFSWKDLFTEYIAQIFPTGESLIEKTLIMIVVTIILTGFGWFLLKHRKK